MSYHDQGHYWTEWSNSTRIKRARLETQVSKIREVVSDPSVKDLTGEEVANLILQIVDPEQKKKDDPTIK